MSMSSSSTAPLCPLTAMRPQRWIVSSMLEMAQSLHLPVVIEGIETNEQANTLRQMGDRYAQGFLYYRPMQAKDFWTLLDGGNNN